MSTIRRVLALFALGLATALPAQIGADYTGISVSAYGVSPTSNRVTTYPPCGLAFNCTPLQLQAQGGDTVRFFIMGRQNGLYILAGTLDTSTPICLPLGIPGLVNDLVWVPGPGLVTLAVGTCSVPDNGRCNGGASPTTVLLTIPTGITGSMGLQALAEAPLSAGGNGFALSHAVAVNF